MEEEINKVKMNDACIDIADTSDVESFCLTKEEIEHYGMLYKGISIDDLSREGMTDNDNSASSVHNKEESKDKQKSADANNITCDSIMHQN